MSYDGFAALLLVAAFVLVTLGGPLMRTICIRQGMMAALSASRAHKQPTPHGGGMLLVLVGVGLGVVAVQWLQLPNENFLNGMLVASLAVAGIGWVDDKRPVDGRTRLLVHLGAVGVGVALLPPLFDIVPLWLEKLVLLLAWSWFISLYNFMDGADGVTSVEAVSIGLGVCLLVPPLAPLAAIVAGLGLGFLRMNWSPARLFLGDVGATWLGYVLGGLLFLALVDETWRVMYPLATVSMLFWADASWTLVRRACQGYSLLERHRTFWFHRALTAMDTMLGQHPAAFTHRRLALYMVAINGLLLAVALTGFALDAGPWTLVSGMLVLAAAAGVILVAERRLGSVI